MKVNNINNSAELKNELVRLSRLRKEQEMYLGDQYKLLQHKVKAPVRVISTIASSIPGVGLIQGLFSSFTDAKKPAQAANEKPDWLTKVTQIGLPLILNRTLLKNSGWLKKTLVLLASEGAAGQVTKDKVSSFVGKIADFVRPGKSKKKHKNVKGFEEEERAEDFGVPPDNETYFN